MSFRPYIAFCALLCFVFLGRGYCEIPQFIKSHIGVLQIPHEFAIEFRSMAIKKKCIDKSDMKYILDNNLVPICDPKDGKIVSLIREYEDRDKFQEIFLNYLNNDLKRDYLSKCKKDIDDLRYICSGQLQKVQSLVNDYLNFIGGCRQIIRGIPNINKNIPIIQKQNWSVSLEINLELGSSGDCGGANWHYGSKIRYESIMYNDCVKRRDNVRENKYNTMVKVDSLSRLLFSLSEQQFKKVSGLINESSLFLRIYFIENPAIGDLFPQMSYLIREFKKQREKSKIDENYEGFWLLDFDPITFADSMDDNSMVYESIVSASPEIYLLQNEFRNLTNKILNAIVDLEKTRIIKTEEIKKEAI